MLFSKQWKQQLINWSAAISYFQIQLHTPQCFKSLSLAANVLAYGSYCIRLTLLGITALEKYLMPVTYKWWLADFQKPLLKTATYMKSSSMHFHSKQDMISLSLYPGPDL